MGEELKKCPFCGPNGAPLRRIGEMDEYRVECVECYTVRTPWFKTPGEAEAYWNAFAKGMEQQAVRIAELEAERDRLREALQVIASGHLSGMVELVNTEEMKTVWKSDVGLPMTVSEARDIARKALKGAGE